MPAEEATEDQHSAPPPPGSMVPWRFSSRCFCCCCEAYLVCAPHECHPRGQLTAEKGDRNLSCFASMQLEWTRGQRAFSMAVSSSSLRGPDDAWEGSQPVLAAGGGRWRSDLLPTPRLQSPSCCEGPARGSRAPAPDRPPPPPHAPF